MVFENVVIPAPLAFFVCKILRLTSDSVNILCFMKTSIKSVFEPSGPSGQSFGVLLLTLDGMLAPYASAITYRGIENNQPGGGALAQFLHSHPGEFAIFLQKC